MFTIEQILTLAYKSEYESAYDLTAKKKFSNPKVYTANGNLKKRWYVYFSFRDPNSGKLKRLTPFYGNANQYKTKEERMEVLIVYQKVLLRLLKQGYNPFLDNTEVHKKLHSKNTETQTKPSSLQNLSESSQNTIAVEKEPKLGLREAFDLGLKLKEKLISERTKKDYENKINVFLKWIDENQPNLKTIDSLTKKNVSAFLNHIQGKTSPRNRNNYRTDLCSIIQVLEDSEFVASNVIKKIPILKTKPERHKPYTRETQEAIFSYLEDEDPILLLFIKFISFGFMRPIEVCRLKIKNFDIESRTIRFKAKNSSFKTKIIPEILWEALPDLSNLEGENTLFTPNQIGGVWDTNENNKRDYFSKRFKRVVKDHFDFGADYGLYSFRHTYTIMVYRALLQEYPEFEAKSKLMMITGHKSMAALEKYLRDIDAELPEDYSKLIKGTND